MRYIHLLFLSLLLVSCNEQAATTSESTDHTEERFKEVPDFQAILDSSQLEGSILIFDNDKNTYYSNDFTWARKGYLPASTFKITNSIIALETGVVDNDSTVFKWHGDNRRLKVWEQDLVLKEAFHYSCVPCYQEVARKIGAGRMNQYLDTLDYGSMEVNSSNIDVFWLEGESQITQLQQIDFLKRFYQSSLPISSRTEMIMKRMMLIEETNHYKISGKTGWSIRNGNNNAWFVGYVEVADKVFFFATNVEPMQEFNMEFFPILRKKITYQALKQMEIITQ